MIGSFLTKTLALALGYAYPAYECFKTVELNKPEIEQLRFWCQYWILVAALTVFERVGESFISWLPMYSEAKVAFLVYLWYPKTKGTSYVYETFFRPYVAKHETEIDRNLLELRTRAGDMVIHCSQRMVSYGQTRVFEILQYVASQSASQSSRPRPDQQHWQPQQAHQTVPTRAARLLPSPASPTKIHPQETTKAVAPSSVAVPIPSNVQALSTVNTTTSLPYSSETISSSTSSNEFEAMQVQTTNNTVSNKDLNNPPLPPPPQETVMVEAIHATCGKSRKRAAMASAETQ